MRPLSTPWSEATHRTGSEGAGAHAVPSLGSCALRSPPFFHFFTFSKPTSKLMSIAIANGHTVAVHYRLTLQDGTVAEDTQGGEPHVFTQGERTIPPGLERDLAGLRAGDEREVILAPADGYGELDPSLEQTVERSLFPADAELEPGMSFGAQSSGGVTPVWVKEVREDKVIVTQNHPLAGQSLMYKVRVVDVQEAAAKSAEPPST